MATEDEKRTQIADALKPHLRRLWRFALCLTGDETQADDMLRATCLKCIERAGQFEDDGAIDRWAYANMVSVWRNHVHADRPGTPKADLNDIVLTGKTRGSSDGPDRSGRILAALGDMPDAIRVTFCLVYVERLAYHQAAETLEIPLGTVMSRLASGRKALTRALRAPETMRREGLR